MYTTPHVPAKSLATPETAGPTTNRAAIRWFQAKQRTERS
jgi:hypothetical protein